MAVERAFLGSVLQLPGCQGLTDKAVALATSPGTSHSAMRMGTGLHVNSAGAHKAVLLAAHVTSPGIEDNARQDLCGTHLKGVGSSRLRRVRSRGSKRGSGFFRDCVGNRSRLHVIAAGMENAGAGRGPSRGIPPKATPASPSSPVTRSQAESLREQNQRLLAMQQELLEQIEERKRLHSELLNSLDNSSPKVKSVTETPSSWVQHVPENYADGELVLGMPATHSDPESSVVYGHEAKPSAAKPTAAPPSRQRNFSPSIPASPSRRQYLEPEGTVKSPPEVEPSTRWPSSALRPTSLKMPDIKERKGSIDGAIAVKEVEPAEPVEVEKPPPLAGENVMNVVLVAAECAPWSKTGGLGDVAGALPKALARRGHRVMVVAPRYKVYEDVWDTTVRKRYTVNGQDMEVGYFHCYMDGVDYVFIENGAFLHCGDNIYGGSREELVKRCILLCKAAVEAPWHVPCGGVTYGDSNLVFIANDWHTALLPVYLQAYYRDNGLMQFARAVLVLHNMAHQGRSGVDYYRELGLPDQYLENFKLFDPVGGEHMNILMAGIKAAHRLVAVSTGYAWEIQTEEGGWGLHNVIRDSAWKLRGVVNGIDDTEWGPSVDRFLTSDGYCHYDVDTLETGKAQCKAALQKELGLPVRPDVPLLGFIGRLDYQKGVDLIQDAKDWMMQQEIQLVMLGSGREDLENTLRRMEGEHRDKCRGWVGFSVKMAHRITAACDILLMPSRFEPCGLNQLYAMRYGTVPVVHAVGGLRDTVTPFDPYNDAGLGWTFDRADTTGLIHALGNAIYTYREYLSSFRDLQRRGMTQDLSWDAAAAQYEEVMVAAKYQW